MARKAGFAALVLLCLAGAHARVLQQDAALAPGAILVEPPTPPPSKGPKLPKDSLGKLTGLKGLPPVGIFIFPNGTTCQNNGIGNIGCSNDGNFNVGIGNKGDFNVGNVNNGNFNDASGNLGSFNTGSENAGSGNSGNQNNGDYNVGNQNNGKYNTGNQNQGTANKGNANLGIANSGNKNNGNFNGGDTNLGSGNNGSTNHGEGNLGSFNYGSFNTESKQTGNYIGPDGTVAVYPITLAPAPLRSAAAVPTLSEVLTSQFQNPKQKGKLGDPSSQDDSSDPKVGPIQGSTSLGALIGTLANVAGR